MMRRGFNYRHAAQLIRPDLLAKLPPRCPQPGEQLSLWADDQQQREPSKRAARRRAARERRR